MPDNDDQQPPNEGKKTPRKRRGGGGKARMTKLAAQTKAERGALAAEMISDLGRPATAIDRVVIESIASAAVRGRQLRDKGHDDVEEVRMIAQLLRASGLKPEKPVSPRQEDFSAEMRRLATPPQGSDEA